jgi:hypothetical protein
VPSESEKKYQPQSTQRSQRLSSQNTKKQQSFYEYFILFASSRLSAACFSYLLWGIKFFFSLYPNTGKDKRITEEEAERAEVLF